MRSEAAGPGTAGAPAPLSAVEAYECGNVPVRGWSARAEGGYRSSDGARAIQKAATVASEVQHHVVILYEHALLGEGIAKYLRAQTGVEATVVSGQDLQAVTSALAFGPTVVIFEQSDTLRQVDLVALAPQAVLIDVSTVVTRGPVVVPTADGLETILHAVTYSSGPLSLPSESCLGGTRPAPAP